MSDPQVFLSYAHEDKPWAEAFANALRDQGLSLWFYDWDLKPGDALSDAIGEAFRTSGALVVLLGPRNVETPALFFELGAALALNKRIISIVSEEVDRSKIPLPFRRVRYLVQRDPEETAEEVARAVA
jgi:hypothetical protein